VKRSTPESEIEELLRDIERHPEATIVLKRIRRKPHSVDSEMSAQAELPALADQRVGGQSFPPSLPAPPGRSLSSAAPTSTSSRQDRSRTPERKTPVEYAALVQDSAADAEDDAECLSILACTTVGEEHLESEGALLAGARRELDLKHPKWRSEGGKAKILAGVTKEWNTLHTDKGALVPISPEESCRVLTTTPDRVIPSRLVLTEKVNDAGDAEAKARLTGRGDKDPDVLSLVREGKTASPTISSNGRLTALQTIASCKFQLQLGDVTGAFLESDPLVRERGELYLKQPSVGIPGLDKSQLPKVIKPVYGLSDAPQHWWHKWSSVMRRQGWSQSKLDPCLFILREESGKLAGILAVHVDDALTGGRGDLYDRTIADLRKTFPFREL